MPQKKEVMEFKVQVSIDGGKSWVDSNFNDGVYSSFEYVKNMADQLRAANPYKYRIVGRELLPWCEIKEDEVKYGG